MAKINWARVAGERGARRAVWGRGAWTTALSKTSAVAVVLAIAVLVAATGCAAAPSAATTTTSRAEEGPLALVVDTPPAPTFTSVAQLCGATLVAEASVVASDAGPNGDSSRSRWNTPDGARPPDLGRDALVANGYAIYTPLALAGVHPLVDHRHQPTAAYATVGGIVGADSYYRQGFPPRLPAGRYLLVFVPAWNPQVRGPDDGMLVVVAAFAIDSFEQIELVPPPPPSTPPPAPQSDGAGTPASAPSPARPPGGVILSLSQVLPQLARCP